jgi:hypothetical protein
LNEPASFNLEEEFASADEFTIEAIPGKSKTVTRSDLEGLTAAAPAAHTAHDDE